MEKEHIIDNKKTISLGLSFQRLMCISVLLLKIKIVIIQNKTNNSKSNKAKLQKCRSQYIYRF